MKKILFIILVSAMFAVNAFNQAVDDKAVIPVAVTLNSILRLNILSGGTIDFNFNTLQDYTDGIDNSDGYDTKISIASSVDWQLKLFAEDASFNMTDSATYGTVNVLPLNYVGYWIDETGTHTVAATNVTIPAETQGTADALTNTTTTVVIDCGAAHNAGDVATNAFTINWECGTGNGAIQTNILSRNLPAGRYATNVYLLLEPN